MTRAVGDDDSMLKSLQEVVGLFREAQASVFKLMSSVRKDTILLLSQMLNQSPGLCAQIPEGVEICNCVTRPQLRSCQWPLHVSFQLNDLTRAYSEQSRSRSTRLVTKMFAVIASVKSTGMTTF